MRELLETLLDLSTLVFAVTSMLAVGFSYTLKEIAAPLRKPRRVMVALLANFVLVPLLAYAVTRVLSLDPALEMGLLLVSTAAGAPFLIKLTQMADGVLTMLLPLGLGLVVDAWHEPLTERLLPSMNKTSSAALMVLVLSTFLLNFNAFFRLFGTGAILGALVVIAGGFAMGYLLGGEDVRSCEVLGLGTAQRNIAAATVVATQAVGHPDTVFMVVVTSIVSMALLFPVARVLRGRSARHAEALAADRALSRKAPLV